MNPLPPNADELVSAYLDGEAAPHEIDIVESNDALMDRVQSLRALTSGLAAPLTPPIEQKEAHLAAALGAFDELFGTESGADTSAAAPVLAVVPDPATAPPVQTQTDSTVTSLAKARERRRPRRFNTGLIAAAIAAVLLIGSIAALSGGRTQDVANSAAADTADDTSVASDEASDAEAAMDDAMEGAAALELDAGRNAAPAAPVPAQAAESFASEETAMDDDAGAATAEAEPQASDDDAAADSADSADSAEGTLDPPFNEFLGDFETEDELLLKVAPPNLREFVARYDLVEPGLFPGCQQDVPELRIIETPTLLGTATLDGLPVEVHILPTETGDLSLFIVATRGCVPIPPTP